MTIPLSALVLTATLLAMIVIVTRKETDLFIALSQSTVHVPTWRWATTLPIVGDMVGRFWDDDDVTVKTRDHEPPQIHTNCTAYPMSTSVLVWYSNLKMYNYNVFKLFVSREASQLLTRTGHIDWMVVVTSLVSSHNDIDIGAVHSVWYIVVSDTTTIIFRSFTVSHHWSLTTIVKCSLQC